MLAADLVKDGHEVIALSRNPASAQDMPAGVKVEKWDAKTAAGWAHLADGADAIVNLAGANLSSSRWSDERKQVILDSRVNAGKAVVEAVENAIKKPGVVIQSSAVGYYGPYSTERVTEALPPGRDYLADVCVQWEASTDAVEEMGVRRAIIRTGVVLDAGSGALQFMMVPFSLFTGGPVGPGTQPIPWIHPEDEVRAIRFLIENPDASGPFNLAAPKGVTNAEFSNILGKVMGRPSWLPLPSFAMKMLVGEVSFVLLKGQFAYPKRLEEMGFTFTYATLEPALRDLLQGEPAFNMEGVDNLRKLVFS
jgi:hypothetical protein